VADDFIDNIFVTAILVTHDGAMYLPKTVASIGSQTRQVDHLIAVDTGSLDSSRELLKNAKISVKDAPRTTGFGTAVSSVVAELGEVEEGAIEWLWLLHDDSAPAPNALAALIAAVVERPTVAIAGPKIRGWHNQNFLLESGVSIAGNGARWTGLEIREYDQGQHDGIRDVLAVSTAGMFIRRDIFEELVDLIPNYHFFEMM
jgi:GT2 family glycosyltransferase